MTGLEFLGGSGIALGRRRSGLLLFPSQGPAAPPATVTPLAGHFDSRYGVTLDGSSRVSSWKDWAGGCGDAVQATAGSRPFVETYQGVQLLRFAGTLLTTPNPASIAFRNATVFVVMRAFGVGSGRIVTSSNTMPFIGGAGSAGQTFAAGKVFTAQQWRINPQMIGVRSGAAVTQYGNVEANGTGTLANNFTAAGIGIGGDATGGNLAGCDLYKVLVYNGQLTDGEVTALKAWLVNLYSLPTTDYTKAWVWDGDSITAGSGVPDGSSYPVQAMAADIESWRVTNTAVSGSTVASLTTRAAAETDAIREAGYTRNVLAINIGRNDMNSLSALDAYNGLVTYAQARVAAGWEVHGSTLIAAAAGVEAKNNEYNARIRGTSGFTGIVADAGASGVIDFASLPQFDTSADASNTTYYQGDTTHPTKAGAAILGQFAHDYMLAH